MGTLDEDVCGICRKDAIIYYTGWVGSILEMIFYGEGACGIFDRQGRWANYRSFCEGGIRVGEVKVSVGVSGFFMDRGRKGIL